jgi:DNA-damage-inducible protein J
MNKSATVRARIEPRLKKDAEGMLEQLGLSATQAITLFYRQITLRKGLPFDVVIPNATTQITFQSTDAGKDIVVCEDADDMFRRLGIKCAFQSTPGNSNKISNE